MLRPLLVSIVSLGILGGVPAHSQSCPPDFAPVADYLAQLTESADLAGCALLVQRDDQTLYEGYFGTYTVDTVVPIASATKWVSAVVVMSLVDEGLLALDDTTAQWLGWQGAHGTITLRQLFSHSSGLPEEALCLGQRDTTLADCVQSIYELELIAPPGTLFSYGGASMQVAGRMCEVAAARPWAALVVTRLTDPLGLETLRYNSQTNPRIAGGASCNLRDYGRVMRMIAADGAPLLSAATMHQMLTEQTRGLARGNVPACAIERGAAGYAIGGWVDRRDAAGAAVLLSSPGAFGFTPWYDRERRLTGVFLVASSNAALCNEIIALTELVNFVVDSRAPGNANCDAAVNNFDIDLWVAGLLGDALRYSALGGTAACWEARSCWGDVNGDGAFNNLDIDAFVVRLTVP